MLDCVLQTASIIQAMVQTVQFAISDTAGETTISNISDIGVAIIQQSTNTTLNAVRNIDYTAQTGDAFITMLSAPADGDKVIVYNNADAEYTISGDGTEITIAGLKLYKSLCNKHIC